MRTTRLPLAGLCLALTAIVALADDTVSETGTSGPKLVETYPGNIPLVLTAPHGGTLNVPGALPRRNENGRAERFVVTRDSSTSELALEIAKEIEKSLGKRPFVVVMRAHRRYLDANRPPAEAYESAEAKAVYDEFHAAVTSIRGEIVEKWGTGLLIDVHGQIREQSAVFRGTRNGATVERLHARSGDAASRRFNATLEQAGLRMLPPSKSPAPDRETTFTGGYIVIAHGTGEPGGIDAIQLEFGGDLRRKEARPITARETAAGLIGFLQRNYHLAPKSDQTDGVPP